MTLHVQARAVLTTLLNRAVESQQFALSQVIPPGSQTYYVVNTSVASAVDSYFALSTRTVDIDAGFAATARRAALVVAGKSAVRYNFSADVFFSSATLGGELQSELIRFQVENSIFPTGRFDEATLRIINQVPIPALPPNGPR